MQSTEFWALPPAEREKLLQGPALAPPPGVEPNFDNPPNGNAVVISVCGTCLVVGSFFVFVRVSGMGRSWKKIFISDYLMLVSYVLFVAYVAVLLREVHVGFLVHQWDFRLRDLPEIFYLFTLATNFFTTTILLLKTAILLEWQRLFVPGPGSRRRNCFFWTSAVLLAVNFLFNAAAVLVVNLACTPHEKNWDMLVPGRCFDGRALFVASAVVNFAIDLAILVLPQKVIWGLLQLSFRKRLGVSVVFVVGVIACIAAAFRIPVSVRYTRSQDVTYDFCIVGIWAMVEATCGLIVYCTPAFPKALAKLRGGNNNNNKTTPPPGPKTPPSPPLPPPPILPSRRPTR
ncbi:hypothetical protein PG991_008918 [Apiospora marii]|uniref:Rhodopsin domain-containing protein n=1 Tax=Apiospora marii TaxID=335849 RepID=A0ABR1RM56_9PEZI